MTSVIPSHPDPEPEALGTREQKKQATRDALTEAASRLFGERGFDAVTVDEIASAAGISRRTFFRYFATKEAVAFPRREARRAGFLQLVNEADSNLSPYGRVRAAMLAMARYFMSEREGALREWRIVSATPSLVAHNRDIDQDWHAIIADSMVRAGTEPQEAQVIAAAMMGVIRVTLDAWFANDAEGDLEQLGREALAVLERGLL